MTLLSVIHLDTVIYSPPWHSYLLFSLTRLFILLLDTVIYSPPWRCYLFSSLTLLFILLLDTVIFSPPWHCYSLSFLTQLLLFLDPVIYSECPRLSVWIQSIWLYSLFSVPSSQIYLKPWINSTSLLKIKYLMLNFVSIVNHYELKNKKCFSLGSRFQEYITECLGLFVRVRPTLSLSYLLRLSQRYTRRCDRGRYLEY